MLNPQSEDEIHKEIVNQLVIATPEWWEQALLTLSQSSDKGIDSCEHSITNAKYPADLVEATEELMLATRSLALLYKRKGTPWATAVYEIHQQEDGKWAFKVEFNYK